MESYHIRGGTPLHGEYAVKGAKNAALPILAAALCRGGVHEIYGCPQIGDASVMLEILKSLGADCRQDGNCLVVDSRELTSAAVPPQLMSMLRSSVFLLGSLLMRTGEAVIHRPGGCNIGSRPIDIHIDGLRHLGYTVTEDEEKVMCSGRCRGGRYVLPYPSVGATENLMMAALSGDGLTVLENCAMEPEILDLQGFLRTCGFHVYGAGTGTIAVLGGRGHSDAMYFIMEDRIEAATYLMALAGTGGEGILTGVRSGLLGSVLEILEQMGCRIRSFQDRIELVSPQRLKSPGTVTTAPYPGFPTDCQPQLLTLAACADGETKICEEIFENRFSHKKELTNMGANIETCGKNAIIKGISILQGAEVCAQDLRGGAALVLAGLMAEDETVVTGIHHIERGYEELEKGLQLLGGNIEKKNERKTEKTKESAAEAGRIFIDHGSISCVPVLPHV
ncbi:MAG: UDP-N-acetylglucosamine 1-carboxyvinyltransferase [Anaerovoracaceae bacterium]|nr:UDP-N-acetylglucosamine 1-carboxyvinyltransferase [Anaerovoracaceae bacterium]